MGNISSENMTIKSARAGIAIAGMSRMGAAPTDASKVNADGTLKNKRNLPEDGDPDTGGSWTNQRE